MFSFTSLAMNMVQVMSTQHYYRTWESFSIYLEPCTTNKNTSHFIHFILKNHKNKVYFCLWLFFFFFKWTPPFSHLFCGFGPVQCTLSTCEQCLTKSLGNLQFSWETSETSSTESFSENVMKECSFNIFTERGIVEDCVFNFIPEPLC